MDVWKKIPDVNICGADVPESGLCENIFCSISFCLLFLDSFLVSSRHQARCTFT